MQNSQFKKIKQIIINCFHVLHLHFTFMHLADVFIQSDLQLHSGYTFSLVCVPWESNPQPFALLTQCSTTEPHRILQDGIWCHLGLFFFTPHDSIFGQVAIYHLLGLPKSAFYHKMY